MSDNKTDDKDAVEAWIHNLDPVLEAHRDYSTRARQVRVANLYETHHGFLHFYDPNAPESAQPYEIVHDDRRADLTYSEAETRSQLAQLLDIVAEWDAEDAAKAARKK